MSLRKEKKKLAKSSLADTATKERRESRARKETEERTVKLSLKRPSCSDEDEDFKYLDSVTEKMNAQLTKHISVEMLESQDLAGNTPNPDSAEVMGQLSEIILKHIQLVDKVTKDFHFMNTKSQKKPKNQKDFKAGSVAKKKLLVRLLNDLFKQFCKYELVYVHFNFKFCYLKFDMFIFYQES